MMIDQHHLMDDQIFRDYRKWLLKMATVYLPGRPDEWHDLAQEGHIAMWKAVRSYDDAKGALPTWLTTAAKMRMRDCASRETWTGTHGKRGHVRERPALPASALTGSEAITVEKPDRLWEEMTDGMMLAYHRGEINRVLSGFSEPVRKALYRKFWLDEVVPHGLWARAVPVLAERLAHLRSEHEE